MSVRYRNYRTVRQSDGSVSVFSHGPFLGIGRVLRGPFLLFFLCGFLVEFFTLHFATAAAFLLFFAVFLPRRVRVGRG